MEIPNENVNLILRFNSHPIADLVKQSVKFQVLKLRNDVFSLNVPNDELLKYSGTPVATCIKHLNTAYLTSYDKEYETFYLSFNEDYFYNLRNGLYLFDGWWDHRDTV